MMAEKQHNQLRGEMRQHESMSRHTTWRVGGPARCFYRPADIDDLALFLSGLPAGEPLFWLGLGSNLLVRDGGINGTVIATQGVLGNMEQLSETMIRVEAGVACAKVARFCARLGLGGVEFLAGIPGTMGGALAMNAGAFGGETWGHVVEVETIDHGGVRHRRSPREFEIGYRSVQGAPGEWFVAVTLALTPHTDGEAQGKIRALLERRAATQPVGLPSCGSVFRNPEGDHAARLIEAAGLKGECIGGACVSEKHANFIINSGDARAAEIEALIIKVRDAVQQQFGITLIPEVRIVGERQQGDGRKE